MSGKFSPHESDMYGSPKVVHVPTFQIDGHDSALHIRTFKSSGRVAALHGRKIVVWSANMRLSFVSTV